MRMNGIYEIPIEKSDWPTKCANDLLVRLSLKAQRKDFTILEDEWSKHTVIKLQNGETFSVWCSGFEPRMRLQLLTNDNKLDYTYKERSYVTIRGLLDYLMKRQTTTKNK